MDYLVLTAAILNVLATIGHFIMGQKQFLDPVMDSNIEEIPKKVMQSLFHYMSVFMVFTTYALFALSAGCNMMVFENGTDVLKVIGFIYAGFAVIQFFIALSSDIKLGVFKLFQWIFLALIAGFTLAGVYF